MERDPSSGPPPGPVMNNPFQKPGNGNGFDTGKDPGALPTDPTSLVIRNGKYMIFPKDKKLHLQDVSEEAIASSGVDLERID